MEKPGTSIRIIDLTKLSIPAEVSSRETTHTQ
jgi:hypothetical protein